MNMPWTQFYYTWDETKRIDAWFQFRNYHLWYCLTFEMMLYEWELFLQQYYNDWMTDTYRPENPEY